MTNPTPEQLATFLHDRGCMIVETDTSYFAYTDNRYSPPFLKEDKEIGGR